MLSVSLISVPSFVVAIYALIVFAVWLNWLPAIGAGEAGDFWSQVRALILPAFAVGIGWVGYLARLIRASMLEVLAQAMQQQDQRNMPISAFIDAPLEIYWCP